MGQANLINAIGSVAGVGNAAASLASLLTGGAGTWAASIRQASFRGVPFGVWGGDLSFGRVTATHRYPQRNGVWVEDLGRDARLYHLQAFLLENSFVYGGGPVAQQRLNFIQAFETAGSGTLIHPTLGRLTVSGLSAQCEEKWDAGRYFSLSLTFIEQGAQQYPSMQASTGSLITQAIGSLDTASLSSFTANVANALTYGASVISANVTAALSWYTSAVGLVHDVKRFFNSVSTLVTSVSALGSSYGRYFGAANAGYSATTPLRTAPVTVALLIANDAAARTALNVAGAALVSAAANPADGATYTAAAQNLAAALAASAADPGDRLRLTVQLATPPAPPATTTSPVGDAIATMQTAAATLFSEAALGQVVQAAGAYQPSSQDDATSVAQQVTTVLDSAILAAGDAGSDDVYNALLAAKNATVMDLKARGGALAPIVAFEFNASLPALTLAQRIYRDGGRSDDLIVQANPVHPAFFPTAFSALAT
jgi:prophage DNA circulation protein